MSPVFAPERANGGWRPDLVHIPHPHSFVVPDPMTGAVIPHRTKREVLVMIKGFKDFLMRGNVVDHAVAVVIGAAFTAVVTAFTSAFLKPLIQLVSGGGELAGTFVVNGVSFDYASFINQVVTFVITAAVVYFLVVYPMQRIAERRKRGEESGPAEPTDVELLTEIRDLLATRGGDDRVPAQLVGSRDHL